MAAATTSSPKTSPQRPNGLLEVTIKDWPLVAAGDELEEQVRRFGFEWDVADLVDHEQRVAAQPHEFGLQPSAVCGRRRACRPIGWRWRTAPGARLGSRGSPARSPGGFSRCRVGRGRSRSPCRRRSPRWRGGRSGRVSVRGRGRSRTPPMLLRAGNRAARIRPSPPWASRAATSRCRQAARIFLMGPGLGAGPLGQPARPIRAAWALSTPGSDTPARRSRRGWRRGFRAGIMPLLRRHRYDAQRGVVVGQRPLISTSVCSGRAHQVEPAAAQHPRRLHMLRVGDRLVSRPDPFMVGHQRRPSHHTRTRSRSARTTIRRPIAAGCTE